MSDLYHNDPNISDCIDSMMRGMTGNPLANPDTPPASIKDIVATIEKLFGKAAAAGVRIGVH
jgi:hypothetical protein